MKINYIAVAVAALGYWILGALWYTVFGNLFIAIMRWTPEQVAKLQAEGASAQIGIALVSSLVLAFVLAHFIKFTGAETAAKGAQMGFWIFLGFVLTTNLETVLFEFRPLGLYLINNGYHLVGLVGMGALLAVWKRRDARVPAYQT